LFKTSQHWRVHVMRYSLPDQILSIPANFLSICPRLGTSKFKERQTDMWRTTTTEAAQRRHDVDDDDDQQSSRVCHERDVIVTSAAITQRRASLSLTVYEQRRLITGQWTKQFITHTSMYSANIELLPYAKQLSQLLSSNGSVSRTPAIHQPHRLTRIQDCDKVRKTPLTTRSETLNKKAKQSLALM